MDFVVVIMFHGVCIKPPQLALVTEYVDKGSLYHLLHWTDEIKNLSWREKINILHDICRYHQLLILKKLRNIDHSCNHMNLNVCFKGLNVHAWDGDSPQRSKECELFAEQ